MTPERPIESSWASAPPLTASDIALEVPLERIVEVHARDLVGAGALEIKIKDDGGALPAAIPTDGDGEAEAAERCAKVDAVRAQGAEPVLRTRTTPRCESKPAW